MIFLYFFLALNLIAFLLFTFDKYAAIKRRRRVPEVLLLLFALVFGATGGFFGMLLCRHKTNHISFLLTVPPLAVIQLITVGLVAF